MFKYSLHLFVGLAFTLLVSCAQSTPSFVELSFDLVIKDGRVIDPETGLDSIYSIGINNGKITAISDAKLNGKSDIDATGLVVAPGFIDIHSHSPTPLGTKFQALDGVTTQLDLEAGAFPVSAYGFMIKQQSPINYGSSVSHLAIRIKVIEGLEQPYLISEGGPIVQGHAFVNQATQAQIKAMRALLVQGLEQGGIGIGVLLDYLSDAITDDELQMIFDVAAAHGVPVTVHIRRGLACDPKGLIEIIELAEQTGAATLICHITHSAMQALPSWLAMIDAANERGAKIATETLSYAAGGTSIGAAVFKRDWQKIFNITYEDVQWTANGEWLSEETFKSYQVTQPSGMVNHHYVKEEWLETAMKWPKMMISSDVTPAISEDVLSNPNLAGTFSRFIGHYARDKGIVSLKDALAKVSLYPAQWLEKAAPVFAKKGRLQIGMDADIVIFNLENIKAKADYGAPYQASEGITAVLGGGEIVARNGELVEGRVPGKHVLAETP